MRALEPWHLIVLLVVVLVLFGGKKLPDLTRGVAQSMRIFKREIKRDDDDQPGPPPAPTPPLEGRVVDREQGGSRATEQPRHDA
jgi:sec-independent protein translocase protein TatA